MNRILYFIFFDGLKMFKAENQYDNWLSSVDFAVWNNSYVQILNEKIYIMQENVKTLSTLRDFEKTALESLASKYELNIKEENGIFYCYTDQHNLRYFEISENESFVVIYCIEGGRNPESIFIYGVFEKE
jgi:hypothetical protein